MPLRTLALLLAILGFGAGPETQPADPAPPGQPPPERVVIHVRRDHEVVGFVRHEDMDHIVVETLSGELDSFAKAKVLRVVRLVDPLPAQEGTVYLRDGRGRQGVIIEDTFDQVVMEINGVRSALPRELVDYVVLHPTFGQRYAQYKAAALTPQQHLGMCRWLLQEREYELARDELNALAGKSSGPDVQRLLKLVEAQLRLDLEANDTRADEPTDDAAPDEDLELPTLPILSHDDVNLVRVYEINFDRPPKVAVAPETIRTMIDLYGTNREIPASETQRRALFRADPLDIVELLFKLRARELYPAIDVLTEPASLNMFRRRVHNAWLLNSCATTHCHGGPRAGDFFLHRRRFKDERVRYTNLLILERAKVDPDWPLVNYGDPMMSLIIQYGLPRTEARNAHPDVRGWQPVFGRGGQRMLRDTVTWIESMMQPRPHYPVDFEPPRLPPPPDAAGEGSNGREPR